MNHRNRVPEFAGTRDLVYSPRYARMLGSVTAALLLKQVAFWHEIKRKQSFYKFNAPCSHKLYTPGDSWEEELGFSRAELDGARSKIATKITQDGGFSKHDILATVKAEFNERGVMTNAHKLVVYWTDANRITSYMLNEALLNDALNQYDLMRETSISRKCGKPALAGNAGNQHFLTSETTSETTSEKTNRGEPPVPSTNSKKEKAPRKGKATGVEQPSFLGDPSPKPPTPQQAYFGAVCKLLGYDPNLLSKNDERVVSGLVKALRQNATVYTLPFLGAFYEYWWADDWRRQRNASPSPGKLQTELGKFRSYQERGASGPGEELEVESINWLT